MNTTGRIAYGETQGNYGDSQAASIPGVRQKPTGGEGTSRRADQRRTLRYGFAIYLTENAAGLQVKVGGFVSR